MASSLADEKEPIDAVIETAFDIFGSDLPDEAFEVVFEQPCELGWREVELLFFAS